MIRAHLIYIPLLNFKESFVCGPEHKRHFIFKVALNGKDYQPTVPNEIKKTAKANAAKFALQELGLLEKDPNNPLWFGFKNTSRRTKS